MFTFFLHPKFRDFFYRRRSRDSDQVEQSVTYDTLQEHNTRTSSVYAEIMPVQNPSDQRGVYFRFDIAYTIFYMYTNIINNNNNNSFNNNNNYINQKLAYTICCACHYSIDCNYKNSSSVN